LNQILIGGWASNVSPEHFCAFKTLTVVLSEAKFLFWGERTRLYQTLSILFYIIMQLNGKLKTAV